MIDHIIYTILLIDTFFNMNNYVNLQHPKVFFPIELTPNGILFRFQSIGKVNTQVL